MNNKHVNCYLISVDLLKWNDRANGNCFTFNHKSFTSRRIVNHVGDGYGIKLSLCFFLLIHHSL